MKISCREYYDNLTVVVYKTVNPKERTKNPTVTFQILSMPVKGHLLRMSPSTESSAVFFDSSTVNNSETMLVFSCQAKHQQSGAKVTV